MLAKTKRRTRRRKKARKAAKARNGSSPNRRYDEPWAEGDDWTEWGGELILEVGSTAGGAPYGISFDEFREMNERDDREAGWARAKRILREVLAADRSNHSIGDSDIGRVRHLGSGLSYDAYYAHCSVGDGAASKSTAVVVRLPRRSAPHGLGERALREQQILECLGKQGVSLRLPRVIGVVPTPDGLAFAQEVVFGVPLDLRSGRQHGVRPWDVVATVAAICHEADPEPLRSVVPSFPSRRDHAIDRLTVLEKLAFPEASDALAWATENLPPPEPSRLVHGDLLGQNIILDVEGQDPPGLLDWEYATLGDPAYDLAIVTRGIRRPFKMDGGLDRLLDSYNQKSKVPVSVPEIHLHELCLKAGFFLDAEKEFGAGSAAARDAQRAFSSVLGRATGSAPRQGPIRDRRGPHPGSLEPPTAS